MSLSEVMDVPEPSLARMDEKECLDKLRRIGLIPGWPNPDDERDRKRLSYSGGFSIDGYCAMQIQNMLRFAKKESLDQIIVGLIVDAVAPVVDLTVLAKRLAGEMSVGGNIDCGDVPDDLLMAITSEEFQPIVACVIANLKSEQLKALVAKLARSSIRLIGGYRAEIVRAIYYCNIVDDGVLLGCLADSMFEVIDDGEHYVIWGSDRIPVLPIAINEAR